MPGCAASATASCREASGDRRSPISTCRSTADAAPSAQRELPRERTSQGLRRGRRRLERERRRCTRPSAACPAAIASNATIVMPPVRRTRSSSSARTMAIEIKLDLCTGCGSASSNAPATPWRWFPSRQRSGHERLDQAERERCPKAGDDRSQQGCQNHDGRQYGRRPCRLSGQRSLRDLSDHALLHHGRTGRPVVGRGLPNIWGNVPVVQEMQSEGGAAGAVHGALQSGALTTTFTSSQGLMLMLPNMFKIAGELTSTVFHVAARSLATSALSIFGDHSDVMTVRTTGFALLSSAIGAGSARHRADRRGGDAGGTGAVPAFLRRLPHLARAEHARPVDDDADSGDDRSNDLVRAHRARALNPEHPFIRGTAQNPDTFFQAREAVSPYYAAVPGIVRRRMDRFAALTGRRYRLFEYEGAPDAERVLILMGSGAETARETVNGAGRARRESRRSAGSALSPVFRRASSRRAARLRAAPSRCSSRPRSPAAPANRSIWMSSPPRQGFAAGERTDNAARDRRPLRSVLEGFHAGHGQGRFGRAGKTAPRQFAGRNGFTARHQ